MVSIYFLRDIFTHTSFEDFFVKSIGTLEEYEGFFSVDGQFAADFMLRYENYDEDLGVLSDELNIELSYEKRKPVDFKAIYENPYESVFITAVKTVTVGLVKGYGKENEEWDGDAGVGNLSAFDLRAYLTENIARLDPHFSNSYQKRMIHRFISRDFPKSFPRRELDFRYYYENSNRRQEMVDLAEGACPGIMSRFQYGL